MSKKILYFISIVLILSGIGYFVLENKEVFFRKDDQNKVSEIPLASVFAKDLEPIYGNPTRLYVPTANIDAEIIEVGVGDMGELEAPISWNLLGWYSKSAQAGQNGNLIIDGHYDDNYGRPASFWNLKNLVSGDKVYLVDSYGRVYIYQVSAVFFLDITDPNRLEVLEGTESEASLTLITCGGVWLTNKSTYDRRLVVKASRV